MRYIILIIALCLFSSVLGMYLGVLNQINKILKTEKKIKFVEKLILTKFVLDSEYFNEFFKPYQTSNINKVLKRKVKEYLRGNIILDKTIKSKVMLTKDIEILDALEIMYKKLNMCFVHKNFQQITIPNNEIIDEKESLLCKQEKKFSLTIQI